MITKYGWRYFQNKRQEEQYRGEDCVIGSPEHHTEKQLEQIKKNLKL